MRRARLVSRLPTLARLVSHLPTLARIVPRDRPKHNISEHTRRLFVTARRRQNINSHLDTVRSSTNVRMSR
jgi:hypothetical protein